MRRNWVLGILNDALPSRPEYFNYLFRLNAQREEIPRKMGSWSEKERHFHTPEWKSCLGGCETKRRDYFCGTLTAFS